MENRRLAAIFAADIAGYSSLMGEDEARTVQDIVNDVIAKVGENVSIKEFYRVEV